MKRKILIIALIAIMSEMAFPIMRANPTEVVPEGEFRVSFDLSRDSRHIKYDIGDDVHYVSNRILVKPSISVSSSPLIEVYLLAGTADLYRGKTSYYLDDFKGSYELAGGLGAKADLTGFDLDYYGNYRINFYADIRYFKTRSIGTTRIRAMSGDPSETFYEKDNYNWNEYSLSLYASLNYIDWQNVIPYLGIEWFYLETTYDRGLYKMVSDEESESRVRVNLEDEGGRAYFNDPQQWPKIVLGSDFKLESGLVISVEAIIWGKKSTSVSIGASHYSKKEKRFQ
ncbi:MAG: hypothetical protein ACLFSQ_00375 [Candidatus Zixiibacteriota bacterium]